MHGRLLCLLGLSFAWGLPPLKAMDHVTLHRGDQTLHVAGQVLVQAQDGGVLFQARDGQLWLIQQSEIVERSKDDDPFKPNTPDEIAEQLLAELPAGFHSYRTAHYLVLYNTSSAYAEWVGGLFERLYRGFYNFWSNRGWNLESPTFPLVAIVLDSAQAYREYARRDLGTAPGAIIGYYNVQTNRVTTYDLTGVEGLAKPPRRATTAAHINQILLQPAAERTVATIVHEATHQLAYNSGLQTRLADNPFWVSEGLAMFFETPDLRSAQGWRTIGEVNGFQLQQFRKMLPQRPPDRWQALLADDKLFHDTTASAAYAEAWAWNYFLLKTRARDYVRYLKAQANQPPLINTGAEQRLAAFKSVFGTDLTELEKDFLRYLQRIR